MIGRARFFLAASIAGMAMPPALALLAGPINVEQIQPASATSTSRTSAGDPVRISPVRAGQSSASVQEAPRPAAAPDIAPEILEACRQAMAGDRPAPEGVDCMAAMQALAEVDTVTPESSLLGLLGQPGTVTREPESRGGASVDADTVARQLSAGDVQSGSGAAGVIARERAAPPPNSPR